MKPHVVQWKGPEGEFVNVFTDHLKQVYFQNEIWFINYCSWTCSWISCPLINNPNKPTSAASKYIYVKLKINAKSRPGLEPGTSGKVPQCSTDWATWLCNYRSAKSTIPAKLACNYRVMVDVAMSTNQTRRKMGCACRGDTTKTLQFHHRWSISPTDGTSHRG